MDLDAPEVAKFAKAGQFIIFKIDESGERVPLTIASSDKTKGTISIIFQTAGQSTQRLSLLNEFDEIMDILGPLGKPTHFENVKKAVIVAGGVGIAEALPVTKYAKESGITVYSIIGSRSKENMILADEIRSFSDKSIIMTDDGSSGEKGFVTDALKKLLDEESFDICYTVGPDIMMKAVCGVTKPFNLKTIVSLDANMLDATGMCATCRVTVGGKVKFACVDGPEFDGHEVDWDGFLVRQKRFVKEEKASSDNFKEHQGKCIYKRSS